MNSRAWAGALAIGAAIGCSSMPQRAAEPVEAEARREGAEYLDDEGEATLEQDDADAGGDLAPADPYTERPGDPAVEGRPPLAPLRFDPPPSQAGPLASAERPPLGDELAVAFVVVRGGRLAAGGQPLLDFERALERLRQIDRVVGLALLPEDVGADKAANLEELAAVAEDLDRDLVVIDIREGSGGEVLVVHASTAALVVRLPRGTETPTSGELDLYDRLALAAAGLD